MIAFARRLLGLARMLILGVGAATIVCIATLVSMQFGFWFMTRTWSPLPVSRLVELWDVAVPRRYFPASAGGAQAGDQTLIETVLDLPAVVVLLVGLTVLALVYAGLNSLDKGLADSKT